jgi:hypothetical protein
MPLKSAAPFTAIVPMLDRHGQERLGNQTGTYAEWRQLYRHFSEHWSAMARAGAGG